MCKEHATVKMCLVLMRLVNILKIAAGVLHHMAAQAMLILPFCFEKVLQKVLQVKDDFVALMLQTML